MIGAHLLNPSRAYTDIGDAAREWLRREVPADDAAAAADAAGRLAQVTRAELEAREQLALYVTIEVPLGGRAGEDGARRRQARRRRIAAGSRSRVDADVERLAR